MKAQSKKLEKSQLELVFELEPSEVEKEFEATAKSLSQEMKVSGFRPGHVPLAIVKEQIGEEVFWQEAAMAALRKAYVKYILDNKVEAIGRPEIEVLKVAPNNPFVFKAKVAILPHFDLPDYGKIKAKKHEIKIEEKETAKTLEDLRKSRAMYNIVKRPAKNGDRVELNFKARLNKVVIEHGEGRNTPIIIGEKKFIPGFEENLIGTSAGDKKNFSVRFPKDYFQKNLADKDVDFEVEILKVEEVVLPALDDTFAKTLGKFTNLAELKKRIQDNLKHEAEDKEKARHEEEILDKLLEKTTIELPEVLVESELDKIIGEIKGMVESSGGEFNAYLASIKKTENDLRKEFRHRAEKRAKASLILRAIAQKEKIDASKEEVEKEINLSLVHYQHNPEMAKKIQSEEYHSYLRGIIQNRKVFDFLKKVVK